MPSGERVWASEKLRITSITSDCSHYAFGVGMSAVYMFSVTDGRNLGVLLRLGSTKNIGDPRLVTWCSGAGALFIAHGKPEATISRIKIKV